MDKLIPVMRDGPDAWAWTYQRKRCLPAGRTSFGNWEALFAFWLQEFLQRRGERSILYLRRRGFPKRPYGDYRLPESFVEHRRNDRAQKAFERAPETYETWCDMSGTVSDLRAENIGRILGKIDLEERKEGQESNYAYFSENADTVSMQICPKGHVYRGNG